MPCASTAMARESAPIGLQKQLLFDDYAMSEEQNITRAPGKVTGRGVAMKPTVPIDCCPANGSLGELQMLITSFSGIPRSVTICSLRRTSGCIG